MPRDTNPPPGTPIVLQVLPRLDAGGVERGTIEVAGAITRAGGTALVASAGGKLVPVLARAGGRHVAMPLAAKGPWTMWRNAGRLAALVRAEGVGIVHARSRAPAWSALSAVQRTGARFVTTYHGAYNEDLPGKRRYNAVMARGERVIAISRYIAGLIEHRHGTDPARIRVIPRGVDPALFDPAVVAPARLARLARNWHLPDGAPTVLLPGRFARWKGHGVLIEAVARMVRRDVILVLAGAAAGRGRYVAELLAQARAAGIADRVHVAHDLDDVPAAMMLADVVVSASTDPEGFGRVVVEAQAMARMVVATGHGGAAETVVPGVTGWLVPPGDAAALAATIERALALPVADRLALGERARGWVRARYTTAAMQAATLDVYRELARDPRREPP